VPETLVLLHGFGGTRHTWDGVIAHLDRQRYRPLALDLPGHGQASIVDEPTFASCVRAVLAAAPERFALCGYSLGGRIALQLALAAPERIRRLVLVSSSPGIEDVAERASRRAADLTLADELERMPLQQWGERWDAEPLFAQDPVEVRRLASADRARNDPRALAAAMRGLSTGAMEPLWSRLGELSMPVTIVFGKRDAKFRTLAERMRDRLPAARLVQIPGGHRLPLQSAAALARVVDQSMTKSETGTP
jgi:2-succinyl-6-hydroxy-2,4-cyclohexadiene-1-carboxylate synthase